MLLELTVQREYRLEEAFERMLSNYTALVGDCQQAGWRVKCFPVEVSWRGFAAYSLARAFSVLGNEWERGKREASIAPPMQQGRPQDGCGSKEESHLNTNLGLISPGCVTWRRLYDVERLTIPIDSRNTTKDVSRGINRFTYRAVRWPKAQLRKNANVSLCLFSVCVVLFIQP